MTAPGVHIAEPLLRARETALAAWRDDHPHADPTAVALADAIENDRIFPVYQPIVDLTNAHMVAVEALVRIEPPEPVGLENAPLIIEVAERSGLIDVLDMHVMHQACTQLAVWRQTAPQLQLHLNASVLELAHERFIDVVEQTLEHTGLPPDALVVEVTESAALGNDRTAEHVLLTLSSRGVIVALDDFGTGFSSLELLARTPAKIVKLDRSFVAALSDTHPAIRGRAMVVQAAIAMGRSLGLHLVGEGIEHATQSHALVSWGCQYGQGYLYGRPVRADKFDLRAAIAPSMDHMIVASLQPLSPAAIDVGIGLAMLLASIDEDAGVLRAAAMSAATIIASVLGTDRPRAEAAALLATIGDTSTHLEQLGVPADTDRPALRELLRALTAVPVISRETSAGAIARTAWALARLRARGDAELDPALLAAHPDPEIDRELHERIGEWWHTGNTIDPRDALLSLEQRLHTRNDANQRLQSLVGMARAIGSSGDVLDVLEVTAEEARQIIGASSLTVACFDPDGTELEVLVNVGELHGGEAVRPTAERYLMDQFPVAKIRIRSRNIHLQDIGDTNGDPGIAELLRRARKGSCAMVPIIVDGDLWGQMWTTTGLEAPSLSLPDTPFLSAVASFIGIAISRTKDVNRLAMLVHQDALTGLPNRRKLEQVVTERLRPHTFEPMSVALLDIDGLKQLNDDLGYAAGDRLLKTVAARLRLVPNRVQGAFAARLSGDEFCLLVPGETARATEIINEALDDLNAGPPPQPRLTVGIIQARVDDRVLGDVLRRADSAEYVAKRRGISVVVEPADAEVADRPTMGPTDRRRFSRRTPIHQNSEGALRAWHQVLESTDRSVPDALEAIGEIALNVLDLNRWALSCNLAGSETLELRRVHLRRSRPGSVASRPLEDENYSLREFPQTLEALDRQCGFVLASGESGADAAEQQLLDSFLLDGLVALAATEPNGDRWLLELYCDTQSVAARAATPLIDALFRRTFGRAAFDTD
ncbi:MAG: EAL domain-containing protein, partial [Nitriliruptoraceae bacterium]